jgi:hypothetical protein
MLTHEPKHNTLTWTLDYRYNSDFGKYKSYFFYYTFPLSFHLILL